MTTTQVYSEQSTVFPMLAWFLVGIGVVAAGIGLAIGERALLAGGALVALAGVPCHVVRSVVTISQDDFEVAFRPFVRKRVRFEDVRDFWPLDRAGFVDAGGMGWRIPRRGVRVLIMEDGPGVGMRLADGLELRVAGPGGTALLERLEQRHWMPA